MSKNETGKLVIKKKPVKKTKENATTESSAVHVDADKQAEDVQKVEESVSKPELQELTEKKEEVQEIIEINEEPENIPEPQVKVEVPENLNKLVDFMNETGGDIQDYARLNADYSKVNDRTLLNEYYKNIKPHLDEEEIAFTLNDNFSYNEDEENERVVKKKKLALKEEIAKAKLHFENLKTKYYEDLRLKSSGSKDQQEAINFFNRYKQDQELNKKQHQEFVKNTNDYFTNKFEGFDFNIGDKKFRYKISNSDAVSKNQVDVKNFLKTFLDEDGNVVDTPGYHKAIYSAKNIDKIANHFYEQGKADGVKDITANANNITTEARKVPNDTMYLNGLRVKAINGVDTSKLKIKKRK
tara:strand:+ start:2572 stop:3636 length:1065 start_codon:yes stop_codon:yes gene_type:complete